ncbi:OrNVorf27-like [Venturia canescens]|uniref:OrNVorf27-like n=1 Tax=Venturia canescens TaxID=32260 RepID=A0ACB9ZIB9_9HYME|nr:uncharacterized LOC122408852 [Venturia canescens]XP_043271861.1 uncharacterized protein LOC122408852 [Venturia canescens]KAI5630622.1 OrNVorf27-like [Venturia canescens]
MMPSDTLSIDCEYDYGASSATEDTDDDTGETESQSNKATTNQPRDTNEDDDNITVKIDSSETNNSTHKSDQEVESIRLNAILCGEGEKMLPYMSPSLQSVYNLNQQDLELNAEIDRLIIASINLHTNKIITIFVRNTLVLVPIHTVISSRLASHIWPTETARGTYAFPYAEEFNKILPTYVERRETVAFFGVHYTKPLMDMASFKCARFTNNASRNVCESTSNAGIYLFDDFSLVIVRDGRVVDSAIHGFRGNINALVEKYKPTRIYYNAVPGDALDTFMNYPYQPFYEAVHERMVPLIVNTTRMAFNPSPFCERYNTYCSFCKTLKTIKSFFVNHASGATKLMSEFSLPALPFTKRAIKGRRQYRWQQKHHQRSLQRTTRIRLKPSRRTRL